MAQIQQICSGLRVSGAGQGLEGEAASWKPPCHHLIQTRAPGEWHIPGHLGSESLILGSLYKNLYPLTIAMVLYFPCSPPRPPASGEDAVLPLGLCIILCLSYTCSEGQDTQMGALCAQCHLGLWWVWDMGTCSLQHRDHSSP